MLTRGLQSTTRCLTRPRERDVKLAIGLRDAGYGVWHA